MHFQGNGPIGLTFLIFVFLAILQAPVCVERTFFSKKRPKRPPWHITCLIKWLKHQISKNFAVGTLRNVYTKIKPIWTYPQKCINFPTKIPKQKSTRKIQKNVDFLQKNSQFLPNFYKKLKNDENHYNIFCVKILGHLDHFQSFYGNFKPIFSHFCLIYNNRGNLLLGSRLSLLQPKYHLNHTRSLQEHYISKEISNFLFKICQKSCFFFR